MNNLNIKHFSNEQINIACGYYDVEYYNTRYIYNDQENYHIELMFDNGKNILELEHFYDHNRRWRGDPKYPKYAKYKKGAATKILIKFVKRLFKKKIINNETIIKVQTERNLTKKAKTIKYYKKIGFQLCGETYDIYDELCYIMKQVTKNFIKINVL
jgi:hypothetical protein